MGSPILDPGNISDQLCLADVKVAARHYFCGVPRACHVHFEPLRIRTSRKFMVYPLMHTEMACPCRCVVVITVVDDAGSESCLQPAS